jgi:hypothetical protein
MLLSRGLGEAEWVVSVRTASVCNANGVVNKVIKKATVVVTFWVGV